MKVTSPLKTLTIEETNSFFGITNYQNTLIKKEFDTSIQTYKQSIDELLEASGNKQVNETLGIPLEYNTSILPKERLFDLFIQRIEEYQKKVGVGKTKGTEYVEDNFSYIRFFMDMGLAHIPMDIKKIEKLISIAPESAFGTIMCFNVAESGRNGVLKICMGIDSKTLENIKSSEECTKYVIKNYRNYSHCKKMQSVIRYALHQIHQNRNWYWESEKNPEFNILSAIGSLNDDEMKSMLENICNETNITHNKSIEDKIFGYQARTIIQKYNNKIVPKCSIDHYEELPPYYFSSTIDFELFQNIHNKYKDKDKLENNTLTNEDKDKIFTLLVDKIKTIHHLIKNYRKREDKNEKEKKNIEHCVGAIREILYKYNIPIKWENIKKGKQKFNSKEFYEYIINILIEYIDGGDLNLQHKLLIGIEYQEAGEKNFQELIEIFSQNRKTNVEDESDEKLLLTCLKSLYENEVWSFRIKQYGNLKLVPIPKSGGKGFHFKTTYEEKLSPHKYTPFELFISIGFLSTNILKQVVFQESPIGEREFKQLIEDECHYKIEEAQKNISNTFLKKKKNQDELHFRKIGESFSYLLKSGICSKKSFEGISQEYSQLIGEYIQEQKIYISKIDVQNYKEKIIREELGKRNIALTNNKDYFPKEKRGIEISQEHLLKIVKKQIFSTGKLFNPDSKEDFVKITIDKKQVLEEFASHHALHLYQTIFHGNIQLSSDEINNYKEKLIKNALGYKGLLVGKKTHLLENKIIDAKQYLPIENESTTITQDMITQHVKYYAQKTGELFNPVDKDDIMDVFIKKTEKIHQKIEKDINKILENTRNKYIGLFPIGGKIHFQKAVSEEKINAFKKSYGFESTPFQMIHANTSMLLPPCPSPDEVAHMIQCLQNEELISEGNPDLQVCIAGRLPLCEASILGSAMIFCANYIKDFSIDAFSTSHNEATGARIMAYDAGELKTNFKYMPKNITGRTDMLARQDIKDIFLYQFIGSLVSQSIYGGMFQEEGKSLVQKYKSILKTYRNDFILEGNWIYDQDRERDTDIGAKKHHQLIEKCNGILRNDIKNGYGMVIDIKNVLTKYINIIKSKQQKVLKRKKLLLTK